MGPPGELVLGAEEHGIEVELGEGTEIAMLAPRNHNPAVEKFVVSGSSHLEGDDVEVPMGSTVAVAVGDHITVRYVPDERDIEGFEFETSDGLLDIEETLFGQWRFDRNAADFTTVDLGATWTVDEQTDHAHLHLVVRDSRRAEAAGWLAFVIEP
jgi:hypothetical protein